MRARPWVAFSLSSLALSGAASPARAADGAKAIAIPAAAGLDALAVQVDAEHRVVTLDVGKVHHESPIDLAPAEINAADASVESIAIGDGKHVAHVRVPSKVRAGVAWEAIVAGRDPAVLWSAVTGFAAGEAGELAGQALDLLPRDDGDERVVVVGEVREDLRICGQARTLLTPQVLDPQSLTFRGATMQRLPQAQRDDAEKVVASSHGGPAEPPLARLLLATGASTAIGAPSAVTDGDPTTTWSEGRPSDGHGEFLVMGAPADVPITRLAITIASPAPSAHGAAPRTFFLVTESRTIAVTLPEDAWMHPGTAYDIPLTDPLRGSCLSLVLDKAYEHPRDAHPEVTIAELTAYSAFDAPGATLDRVAKALAGGGPRGEAAKGVLQRAGDAGLSAAAAAFGSLDAAGRALAIDAAIGAGTCEASAPLLLAAMGDRDREVARKGREKLERCGRRATPALLSALRSPDETQRANAARLVSSVAPREALDALVDVLGAGSATTRSAVRSAVAKAARTATKEKLAALVAAPRADDARIDLLRALEDQLPTIAPEGDAAIGALAATSPSMRTRYLLVEPIAALARSGDGVAAGRLATMITGDPDPAVRAHAAERAVGVSAAAPSLAMALDKDDAPRVRAAALESLATIAATPQRAPLPVASIARRLADDEWTFVRAAAAATLAASPAEPHVDTALEAALSDQAATVREAVIVALAAHGDAHAAKGIRATLEDEHEALEVRLAAVRAVTSLCDRESIEPLTKLAQRAPFPMATDEDIQLGLAAADALGRLHPADLAARLAPLAAKDARLEARTAASRALATAPGCK